VIIKTVTVELIMAIKSRDGLNVDFVPMVRATRTIIVITSAWIAMLQTLTPPPTTN
jgi:hypothetical protein